MMSTTPYDHLRAQGSFIAQATSGSAAFVAERLIIDLGGQLDEALRQEFAATLNSALKDLAATVTITLDGEVFGPDRELVQGMSKELRQFLVRYLHQNIPTPLQVPHDLSTFTGRENEITSLGTNLTRRSSQSGLVCICGMGGVGKSALVTHFAHQNALQFPDGILWADLRSQATAAVLDSFALAYGIDLAAVRDLYSKAEAVRSVLAEKRALVILDNAEHSSDLDLLLPARGPNLTLVTTRDSDMRALRGAYCLPLKPFPESEAVSHIARVLGETEASRDPEATRLVAKECGYLPLALDIAVTLAKRAHLSVGDLAGLIAQESQKLAILNERDRSLNACFKLSWDSLSGAQREILRSSAVFGGSSFSAEALAFVVGINILTLQLAVGELVAASLMSAKGLGRYYVHPLIREFSADQLRRAGKLKASRRKLAAVDYYLRISSQEDTTNYVNAIDRYALLATELDNILAAFSWCTVESKDYEVVMFAKSLRNFLFRQGYWNDCRRILTSGAESSLALGDMLSYHEFRLQYGELAVEMGAYIDADTCLQECISFFSQQNLTRLHTRVMRELGELRRAERKYIVAKDLHLQCLALRRTDSDTFGIAQSLHDIGVVERILGNKRESRVRLEESLDISSRMDNTAQAAYTRLELGMLARSDGQHSTADELLGTCRDMFISLHDKRGEAYSLRELGENSLSQGHYEDALQYHKRSLELRIELGDRRGEALSRHRLGHVYQCLDDDHAARELFERSLVIADSLHDRLCIALNKIRLGELADKSGDPVEARELWMSGLAMLDELGVGAPEKDVARRHLGGTEDNQKANQRESKEE